MKYIFASDIHGNIDILKIIIEIFIKEKADKLILLGDISAYSLEENEEIANILNSIKAKLVMIMGNCDNMMLEERLEIPMYDIDNIALGNNTITFTHGNRYNMFDLPPFCGNIFIQGHTHIPILKQEKNVIIANPGSPTRPRGSDLRCYLEINEEEILLKTLEGKIIKSIKLCLQ